MKIHGLQKMTLLDYPGRVACTVFFGGCDYRCPFCHNYELVDGSAPSIMDDGELMAFLEKRKGLLDGVAITGGEPLLQKDIYDLCGRIKALGYAVKLDTNGNHPEILKRLVGDGLIDYVAMDVKNDRERYATTCGMKEMDLHKIEESISFLLERPCEYEFRTTVVNELHDAASFENIGIWLSGAEKYYLQSFTDRDTVPFAGFSAPSDEDLECYLKIVQSHIPAAQLRGR